MNRKKIIPWVMMACQMVAWAWMQIVGGKLGDQAYLVFCLGMMLGQIGASYECVTTKAWGTLVVQVYFFIFTVIGGLVRFQNMR